MPDRTHRIPGLVLTDHEFPVPLDHAHPEALSRNSVPCAAAVYYDDMYVDRRFSLETAEKIPGVRPWITNEYEHNGLRAAGEVVLDRLLGMVTGRL